MSKQPLRLTMLPETLAICRLGPADPIPVWAAQRPFFSITRTVEELSILCPQSQVPPEVNCTRGWRAIKLEGPFPFDMVGVLVSVVQPLAEAGVAILAVATYDTDYVLVSQASLAQAVTALEGKGFIFAAGSG